MGSNSILLFLCDPKRHKECEHSTLCEQGRHDYCFATSKSECAKVDEYGKPIIFTDEMLDKLTSEA